MYYICMRETATTAQKRYGKIGDTYRYTMALRSNPVKTHSASFKRDEVWESDAIYMAKRSFANYMGVSIDEVIVKGIKVMPKMFPKTDVDYSHGGRV